MVFERRRDLEIPPYNLKDCGYLRCAAYGASNGWYSLCRSMNFAT